MYKHAPFKLFWAQGFEVACVAMLKGNEHVGFGSVHVLMVHADGTEPCQKAQYSAEPEKESCIQYIPNYKSTGWVSGS